MGKYRAKLICTECMPEEGRETLSMGPIFTEKSPKCCKCGKPITKENFHWIKEWEEDHIEPTFSDPKDFKPIKGF